MKKTSMVRSLIACLTLVMPLSAFASDNANWPTKPITMVVPASPGGDTDLNTRLVCKYLEKELGQTIVVQNVNGGAGSVGNRKVKDSANDGYTLVHVWSGILLNKLFGVADFGIEEFEIVNTTVTDHHSAWFISKNAPFKTLDELVAYSKNVKPITFGTDTGSLSHLTELKFINDTGAKINIVDAGGASEKIQAVLGGHLNIMFTQVGLVQPYLKNGDFITLGIMAEKRSELAPNIPTFKEQGYDLVFDKPLIMLAPKGTDQAIIAKLNKAIAKVQKNPEFIAELSSKLMFVPTNLTRDETIKYFAELNDYYKKVIDTYQASGKK